MISKKGRINKILLIHPPSVTIKGERKICQAPLGLGYISSNLDEKYEVKVLDATLEGYDNEIKMGEEHIIFGLSFQKIREEIVSFAPDLVGISMQSTAYYINGLAVAKIVKYISRDIVVVVGGAYPSSDYTEVLSNEYIDYVVLGEGERSFAELVGAISDEKNVENIDGIAYMDSNGSIRVNPKTKYITDLDSLKFPLSKLLNMEGYFKINDAHFITKTSRATHMITSRGCPNDCSFCTIHDVWGYKYRERSALNVLAEVQQLIDDYGITEIHFEDDNIAYNRERAIVIFEGLKRYNLKWALPNGISIHTLDYGLLELMKQSGCYSMALPFESASQKTLKKIIHKHVDLDHGKNIVKMSRELGIETYGFFIVGFPGETIEEVKQTLRFSASLGLDGIYVFYATPFPGTKLLKEVRQKGYLPEDFNLHRLTIERPTFGTNEFSIDELRETVQEHIYQMKEEGYNYL